MLRSVATNVLGFPDEPPTACHALSLRSGNQRNFGKRRVEGKANNEIRWCSKRYLLARNLPTLNAAKNTRLEH